VCVIDRFKFHERIFDDVHHKNGPHLYWNEYVQHNLPNVYNIRIVENGLQNNCNNNNNRENIILCFEAVSFQVIHINKSALKVFALRCPFVQCVFNKIIRYVTNTS